MSYRIKCYTLFDITKTGVLNRKPPLNGTIQQIKKWEQNRNSQSNFDTIVQVISLRSQPENITEPIVTEKLLNEFEHFGFMYDNEEVEQKIWSFDFTINHSSVFNDGFTELGYLYSDCEGVPIIRLGTEYDKIQGFLDTSPELRNIYFEIIKDE